MSQYVASKRCTANAHDNKPVVEGSIVRFCLLLAEAVTLVEGTLRFLSNMKRLFCLNFLIKIQLRGMTVYSCPTT